MGPASTQVVAVPDRGVLLADLTQTVLAGRNVLLTGPAGIGKTWLAKAAIANADAAGRPSKAIFGTTSSHEVPLAAADGITLLLVDDAELLDGLSGLV